MEFGIGINKLDNIFHSLSVDMNKSDLEVISMIKPCRYRSLSLSDVDDSFCQLEISIPSVHDSELPQQVSRANCALKAGIEPTLSDGAMGGTYFLRDLTRSICAVFKPSDEEPFAPNNPYREDHNVGKFSKSFKGNIFPGFSMYREVIAYALDTVDAGVPVTQLAKVRHKSLKMAESLTGATRKSYKIGSIQSYVRDIECSAEDMGPGMFIKDDVDRIAIIDIRMCNLDRHPGNILVCKSKYFTNKSNTNDLINDKLSYKFENLTDIQSTIFSDLSKSCPGGVESSFVLSEIMKEEMTAQDSNNTANDRNIRVHSNSPSPRSIDMTSKSPRSSSSTTTSVEGKFRLVPIDHGYCLPHILTLSDVNFVWIHWPQVSQPISESLIQYIENINIEEDIKLIKTLVGAAIDEPYLLTLRVCTLLLKKGIAKGLSLKQIGDLMIPPPPMSLSESEDCLPSKLQLAVYSAIRMVISSERQFQTDISSSNSVCTPLRIGKLKHSPSESCLQKLSPQASPIKYSSPLRIRREENNCRLHYSSSPKHIHKDGLMQDNLNSISDNMCNDIVTESQLEIAMHAIGKLTLISALDDVISKLVNDIC